jgi:hypothetical protein
MTKTPKKVKKTSKTTKHWLWWQLVNDTEFTTIVSSFLNSQLLQDSLCVDFGEKINVFLSEIGRCELPKKRSPLVFF